MKRLCRFSAPLFVLGLSLPLLGFAESNKLLLVTKKDGIEELSRKQIKQIYLEGGVNVQVKPVNLSQGNKHRNIFNTKVIGLTESRIQAYWAQMKFTGRAEPPKEMNSIDALIKFLDENPNHIAYVPSHIQLPESFKIVFSLDY